MSTTPNTSEWFTTPRVVPPPSLASGDHLDQPTFHERYLKTPEGFRAELVEGVVYVSSPASRIHGQYVSLFDGWLSRYLEKTPGFELASDSTLILDRQNEVQPDVMLNRKLSDAEGTAGKYYQGVAEVVCEVSLSTEAYDLYEKLRAYERNHVRQYLVYSIRESQLHWYVLQDGKFVELEMDDDRVFRSPLLPGLWLDYLGLLQLDLPRVARVLYSGLASPEHAVFVAGS